MSNKNRYRERDNEYLLESTSIRLTISYFSVISHSCSEHPDSVACLRSRLIFIADVIISMLTWRKLETF